MMRIVFLKLIKCFCELVMWLLFKIWSNMLKILLCVFFILLKSMIEYGWCCIVLVSWSFFSKSTYSGGALIKRFIECFFIYLFILMWIIVFLVLNKKFVNVLYSFVLFMFVGLRNMKFVIGRFGLERFARERWIVLYIDCMVLFWLMICLWSLVGKLRSFFCLFCWSLVMGILVYLEMMFAMSVSVISSRKRVGFFEVVSSSIFFVLFSFCCNVMSVLYFNLVVLFKLYLCLVCWMLFVIELIFFFKVWIVFNLFCLFCYWLLSIDCFLVSVFRLLLSFLILDWIECVFCEVFGCDNDIFFIWSFKISWSILFKIVGFDVIFILSLVVDLFMRLIVLFGKKWLVMYWLLSVVVLIKVELEIEILWWSS